MRKLRRKYCYSTRTRGGKHEEEEEGEADEEEGGEEEEESKWRKTHRNEACMARQVERETEKGINRECEEPTND